MKRYMGFTLLISLAILNGCSSTPSPSSSKYAKGHSGSCSSAKECETLGVRYISGSGVRKNGHKAVYYLDRACSMGRASACNGAAFIYADAEGGVKQDYRKALDNWSRACHLGDPTGCSNYSLAQDKLAHLH